MRLGLRSDRLPDGRMLARWALRTAVAALLLWGVARSTFVLDQAELGWLSDVGRGPGRAVTSPGLHLKWPWQSVRRFDARTQWQEFTVAEARTRDGHLVPVTTFVCWRLTAAELCRRATLPDHDEALAARFLRGLSDEFAVELSRRTLAELAGMQSAGSTPQDAPELSIAGAVMMRCRPALLKGSGLELVDLRIRRMALPPVAKAGLYGLMVAAYEAEAERHQQSAIIESAGLVNAAREEADRLIAQASARAQAIRGEGEAVAGQIRSEVESQNLEFAAINRVVERFRSQMTAETTLVLEGGAPFLAEFSPSPAPNPGPAASSQATATAPAAMASMPAASKPSN